MSLAEKEDATRLVAQKNLIDRLALKVPGRLGVVVKVDNGAHTLITDKPEISADAILQILRNQ